MTQILPFIEQQNLFNKYDYEAGSYAQVNDPVRQCRVPTFMCPSNPDRYSKDDVGSSHYAGCHNDTEAPIDKEDNGILFLNSQVRYSDITDGSSQTILISEVLGDPYGLGWTSGTRATLRNTSGFEDVEKWNQQQQPFVNENPLTVGPFGSFHQGGANFAFADGAVTFLTHSIDEKLYSQFGHRADGEILQQ